MDPPALAAYQRCWWFAKGVTESATVPVPHLDPDATEGAAGTARTSIATEEEPELVPQAGFSDLVITTHIPGVVNV